MKEQFINHVLIGHYVVINGNRCLVTGARRIEGEKGFSFRIWPTHGKHDEFWTCSAPKFDEVIRRNAPEGCEDFSDV
jgi:hypothetical protein